MSCLNCLKCYVNCSSLLIMLLGLLSLGGGIWQITENNDLWSVTDWSHDKYVSLSAIICGTFLFLTGVFGLVGGCKKNNCCLAIFNIGILLLFVAFAFLAIFARVGSKDFQNKIDAEDSCQTIDWLKEANEAVVESEKLFGSDSCNIYVQNIEEFPADTFENLDWTSHQDEGQIKVQDCEGDDKIDEDYTKWMALLEDSFSCSGLCDSKGFYIFTDVNKGVPSELSCKDSISNFIDVFSFWVEIISWVIAGILLFTMVITCCLCCSAKKDPNNIGQSYYAVQNKVHMRT